DYYCSAYTTRGTFVF
nr:immunoglobulin light chain junction region [Macaca mulatta]